MRAVNVHEAKTHLSALLVEVAAGEDVVIARAGKPVARLIAYQEAATQRPIGCDAGLPFFIADDFDAYVPEEFDEYR